MTSLDTEVRAEVNKLKSSEKESRILDAAFDEGGLAFISGVAKEGQRLASGKILLDLWQPARYKILPIVMGRAG